MRRWRAACCRCGWRISWSSRCSRSSWSAPARGSRAHPLPRPKRRRSTLSFPRLAAPESPPWRFRPRCCCSTAASAPAPRWPVPARVRPARPAVCLVDLDFQHGACADYLDLEPRLDLKEIEPRPERLDRQLLEVMLSHPAAGLEVIAAPNRPAEMRSFDPDMVTRLLDLVSSHFDYVVIDMPRTWFSWTDSVLLGPNNLFIVSEMTVPSLRQAKGLVAAIRERLNNGPQPQVIVNRFEQRMFDPGVKKS